jgi:hypothetical protein
MQSCERIATISQEGGIHALPVNGGCQKSVSREHAIGGTVRVEDESDWVSERERTNQSIERIRSQSGGARLAAVYRSNLTHKFRYRVLWRSILGVSESIFAASSVKIYYTDRYDEG